MTDPVWARLDALLHLALGQIEAGRSTAETIAIVHDAAIGFGLHDVTVVCIGQTVTIECVRDDGVEAASRTGTVEVIDAIDCEAMKRLDAAARMIATGSVEPADARRLVDTATHATHRWWWPMLGMTILAFCIAIQVGGRPVIAGVAAAAQLGVSITGLLSARFAIPKLYLTALQAVVASVVTWAAHGMGIVDWPGSAAAAAVAWMLLIPLPILVSTVVDAVTGHRLAAVARGMQLALGLVGLAVGVAVVMSLSRGIDLGMPIGVDLPNLAVPLGVMFSMIGAIANAMANGGGRALLLPAAVIGGLTAICNQTLLHVVGMDSGWAATASSVVLGLGAGLWAPRLSYPAPALALLGITGALLPGLTVYQGVVVELYHSSGWPYFLQAAVICVGLGIGTTLGVLLSAGHRRPTSGRTSRYDEAR